MSDALGSEGFGRLRQAVAQVKQFADSVPVERPPNDIVITAVEDHGDLWRFTLGSAWVLLGRPEYNYPGCPSVVVFKADLRLVELDGTYGVALDAALDAARERVGQGQ